MVLNGVIPLEKLQNLKGIICSLENLYVAYQEAAKDKRYREDVLMFTANLDENIFQLREELLSETYEVGRYREFYVHYPKPRLVMALGFRDRVVQWAIYQQINPYADKRFIQHSYGCRKNKGTLAAALCLLNWMQLISRKEDADDWVLVKGDISKYFYRVDHKIVMDVYAEYTDDQWFLRLMSKIINNPDVPFGLPPGMRADDCPREMRLFDVGMPIGNLTSQETANLYLNRFDQYCKHVLRLHFYVRYMDDFIIPCKRAEADRILSATSSFLMSELNLDVSPKSRILPIKQGCEFVGYDVSPHGLRLRKKTTRHMKSALLHVADLYAQGLITLDSAIQTRQSYWGMTVNCNGYNMQRWIADNIEFRREITCEELETFLISLSEEGIFAPSDFILT